VRQRQVAASPSRILGAILLVPPSLVLAAVGAALRRATSAAGQRAEYRADELSVAVAGRAATRRLLELMFDAHGAPFAMQVALRRDPSADIWVAEKDYLADLPETERQRIRRNAERAFHRTDDSHPPTQLRIDLLDSRPEPAPLLALDEKLERLVDAELFSCAPVVRTSILDRVRS
jgi:Zn-dependent protease with chaperone function